ncbi:unnamed protein product [Prorocentrum cordatum]|uniref:Uncharacterized protein n=1 Tax=Prorocentrum cordatum TaxID=2364126 RepID=A0ABN9PMQ4_9DINO|nr:unnamed protein product [Polarella glacialis]
MAAARRRSRLAGRDGANAARAPCGRAAAAEGARACAGAPTGAAAEGELGPGEEGGEAELPADGGGGPRALHTPAEGAGDACGLGSSSADCWNRLRDKARVEGELGLSEDGGDVELHDASNPSCLVATGYTRVVYGDHGAYLELDPARHVVWESLPTAVLKPPHAYYDEYHSEGGFVRLYLQKRSVEGKPNPPAGGVRHQRNGGYADYRVGMCYVEPGMLTLARHVVATHAAQPHESRRRWRK